MKLKCRKEVDPQRDQHQHRDHPLKFPFLQRTQEKQQRDEQRRQDEEAIISHAKSQTQQIALDQVMFAREMRAEALYSSCCWGVSVRGSGTGFERNVSAAGTPYCFWLSEYGNVVQLPVTRLFCSSVSPTAGNAKITVAINAEFRHAGIK